MFRDDGVVVRGARAIGRSAGISLSSNLLALAALLLAGAFLSGCVTSGSSASGASSVGAGGMSGVKGVVTAPVDEAYIFVYKKGVEPHGPPFVMSRATGLDGSFEVELPDGEYTLVARKHKNGLSGSPLSDGDMKSGAVAVTVKGGMITEQLVLGAKTDDAKYFDASEKSETSISGTVSDSEGNPKAGFRVHVYTYAQMSERPKYVSAATGPDGKFIVYLPKGGTYYIAARDHFGGPPKIGDFYGRYDEGTIDPSGIMLKTGQRLENVNITVHKVW